MASFFRFLDHTLRHVTLGRTPLDELSASRRDLCLITHIKKRQTTMPPAEFKPTVPASERPQIHALDRVAIKTSTRIKFACCEII
jgi:hypothetical protein